MQKSVQVRDRVKRKSKEKTGVIVTSYTNKLVIERQAWPEPYKTGDKWHTVSKIELNRDETDDLVAVLPQAILERERAKKANRPKGSSCYSADIIY